MPELPEVETIRNRLIPRMVKHRITGVDLPWPGIVKQPSTEEFLRRIAGQKVKDIGRRGKYLLLHLDRDVLILHLKMTGALLFQPSGTPDLPYTRAIFNLDNNTSLFFCDQRKFGAVWLVKEESEIVGKMGPEPLTPAFTPGVLKELLARHDLPVKALLCDQNIIAGIGNMYADEALFAARIHPAKKARELSGEESERLHQAIRQVLAAGIENGGASVNTYQHPDGSRGTAQLSFQVAHRFGQPCPVCNTPIQRMRLRGRGTYYCPNCQGEHPA